MGYAESLAYHSWPAFDPAMLVDETIEVAGQINGKVRDRITVAAAIVEAEAV